MFASSSSGPNPAEYDSHGGRRAADPSPDRRHSPDDLDASSAEPLRTQFLDYDQDSPSNSRRESFIDSEPDNSRRYNQGLSASSVAGYQTVGGEHSEPGSPAHNEGYERSHESGSSGTKVDQSQNPRPDTMSSEGSYENGGRSAGGNHTVSPCFLLALGPFSRGQGREMS